MRHCGVRASHLQCHLLLQRTDSRALAQKLPNTGFVALWHVRSSQTRDRTCVLAFAGRFLSTRPPGEPLNISFYFSGMGEQEYLVMWQLHGQHYKKLASCLPGWLIHLIFSTVMFEQPSFTISSLAFGVITIFFFHLSLSDRCTIIFYCGFNMYFCC